MPGYVINLGVEEGRLQLYVQSGIYGTSRLGRTGWYPQTLYTLADYLTMRPGDLIFFFQRRIIYGIGTIVAIVVNDDEHCVFCNSPRSYLPSQQVTPPYLWNGDKDPHIRWRVLFQPAPAFFATGVDMDEVLQADSAGIARSLRVFSNRSFIKTEDDESHLVATAILRRNEAADAAIFPDNSGGVHQAMGRVANLSDFLVDSDDLVAHDLQGSEVQHEPTLQAWLADRLTRRVPDVTGIFGDWDYVSNLYPASPLKPRQYMEEIDVFGYVLAPAQPPIPPYVRRFKVIEVKAGSQTLGPSNVVDQVMKYVDWVSSARAGGDYGLIDAYIVASDFAQDLVQYAAERRTRSYVIPRRPYETRQWASLTLVKYQALAGRPAVRLDIALPAS